VIHVPVCSAATTVGQKSARSLQLLCTPCSLVGSKLGANETVCIVRNAFSQGQSQFNLQEIKRAGGEVCSAEVPACR
jgi:hypothetical protein